MLYRVGRGLLQRDGIALALGIGLQRRARGDDLVAVLGRQPQEQPFLLRQAQVAQRPGGALIAVHRTSPRPSDFSAASHALISSNRAWRSISFSDSTLRPRRDSPYMSSPPRSSAASATTAIVGTPVGWRTVRHTPPLFAGGAAAAGAFAAGAVLSASGAPANN